MTSIGRVLKRAKERGNVRIDLLKLQTTYRKEKVRQRTAERNPKLDKCSHCGSTDKLTRHHISYQPNRWITLCDDCHVKLNRQEEI